MLQTKAVEPRTLSLLKELMTVPSRGDCHLFGGTTLALIYGHRISVDRSALTYFDDANESETPVSLNNETWPEIKSAIQAAAREYLS